MSDLGSILGSVLKHYTNSNVPQSQSDVQNVDHQQVYDHYQQYAQQAPPQQVYEAFQQAYQQMNPQQQQNVYNSLMGALQQHGVNPQQIGVQPDQPSAQNYAKATQHLSQNPDLLHQVLGPGGALSSPIAKIALAGALAVAANKLQGRGL